MGDPAGIGAEVTAKALQDDSIYEKCRPFVVGNVSAIDHAIEIAGLDASGRVTHELEDVAGEPGVIDVMDPENLDYSEHRAWGAVRLGGQGGRRVGAQGGRDGGCRAGPGNRDRADQQGSGKYGRVQGHRPHGDLPEPDELERGGDDAHGRRAPRRPPHDAPSAPRRLRLRYRGQRTRKDLSSPTNTSRGGASLPHASASRR